MSEKKEKKYLIDNSVLMAEWDWEKNGKLGLNPNLLTFGSNKKAWWICPICNSTWLSSVNSRFRGIVCPNCRQLKRNRTIIAKNGSLLNRYPEIAKFYCVEKNEFSPADIPANSNRKVWWKCENGHLYYSSVSSRVKGHKCPYCAGLYPTVDNNLAVKAPRLVSEWNFEKNGDLTPDKVTPNSDKKVWWKCKNGHEWVASIGNRYRGRNCPHCSSQLKTSFPEQAIYYYLSRNIETQSRIKINNWEVDIFLPNYNLAIEYDGIAYHNKHHLIEREKKKDLDLTNSGVQIVRVKESYDKSLYEDGILYFIVDHKYTNLEKVIYELFNVLRINFNVDIKPPIIDIENDKLSIQNLYMEYELKSSFAVKFPELLPLWNYDKNGNLRPTMFRAMSNQKVWWKCEKGHEWVESIINVAKGNRCPYCSGHKVLRGFNDIATTHSELLFEWDFENNVNLSPYEVSAGSNIKVWWKCKNGHNWQAKINDRTKKKNGCPYCSNKKILKGYNDLETLLPDLAKEWNYEKNQGNLPSDFSIHSGKKVWWKCKNGHEWQAVIDNRTKGSGCPYCRRKKK